MTIKKRIFLIIKILIISLFIIVGLGFCAFCALQYSGKQKLLQNSSDKPDLSVVRGSDSQITTSTEYVEEENWQEGDIRYGDSIYRYNSDIITFLFLGIDRMDTVKEAKNGMDGGQSDAMFLLVLNPHNKQISIIGINRDTMTDIDVYSKQGSYMGTTKGQICLQHGYGDGLEVSCERTVNAVSGLFYHLPIHGYAAVNMGAIPLINDAIGGVTLTALETVSYEKGKIKEGQEIHLKGKTAYYYLHNRDLKSFNSAGRRLDRQKQYIKEYFKVAKQVLKDDITLPVKLYNTLSKYMVTDITVDEVSFLATEVSDYSLSEDNMYSLKGETQMGEKFEEFYVDEQALYDLILNVFYEKVE